MAGYTRQSTYTDGDVIQAADSNNEFDALLDSFNNATGHAHDGTAAEGPVIGLIGDAGNTIPLNKLAVDTANDRLSFYVDVASTSVEQLRVEDGIAYPVTTNDIDLGTAVYMFKDGYFAGTLESVNLEVTNLKAKDGAASATIADSTGVMTITSAVLTTADINAGTIDNATIGGTTPAAGDFTTLGATGNITVGGTVDGRDVAADGTKLDGVEALADVTDVTNVTAAGALMDSELTDIASVKALNQGVATADSPTFVTVNATTVNATTFDMTNLEVTTIKAKDGTASAVITDATGVMTIDSAVLTTADINAGTVDAVLGGTTPAAAAVTTLTATGGGSLTGTWSDLGSVTTVDINGGTIDGTVIGGTTAAAGSFTTGSFTGDVSFGDDAKALFGTGSDLQIFHDGSNSWIRDKGTGGLVIDTDGTSIDIKGSSPTEYMARFIKDGEVSLYYDNAEKLATTSTGVEVTGNATFADNGKATFGDGSDLQIYHTGSHSYITDTGTGSLYIRGGGFVSIQAADGTNSIVADTDSEVTLYHNGSPKLATTSTGVDVTGTITSDELTVDGVITTTGGTDINMDGAGSGQLTLGGNGYKSSIALNAEGMNLYTNSASRGVILGTNETQRMLVGGNGDIRFYEDTGTTPKFYWDASAERLGIGTVSPATALDVTGTITANQFVGGNISAPKNLIINGGFDVWQRGTSQTTNGYGSDDRWSNSNGVSTQVVSRQTFALGQTDVAGNPKYFSRTVVTSVASASAIVFKGQPVEDVTKTAGKTVTVTFWAKADAGKDIALELTQIFGTGGSPSSPMLLTPQTVTLTTSWVKHSLTFIVPSVAGKTLGTDGNDRLNVNFWFDSGSSFDSRNNSLGQQSGTFDIARVSLCEGDVTALDDPFEERTYGEELALCQRYFTQMLIRHRFPATAASQIGGSNISFSTTMRAAPSLTILSNSYTNNVVAVFLSQVTTSGAIFELQAQLAGDTYRGDNYSFDAEL